MEISENMQRLNTEAILEHLPEGVLTLDAEGYITYSNGAVRTLTGFTNAELMGKPLHFLYGEAEESIKTAYELREAAKQGKFVSAGWKKTRTGKDLWCDVIIAPLFRDSGLEGFTCMLCDTTARKERELQLRRSEQRFRLMVESVKDYAIFMLDPTGHIATWNEGAYRTKGYRASEIIGKHFSIFYTAEDLAIRKPENELRIAVQTGKYEEEGWRIKKNGSLFWASVVITALFSEENQLIGFAKVTRDLTERRGKEEQLRQSEERYRALVEQVTDYGIFMMDEKGRIASWNEGARRINGYTHEEVAGKYFSIFYPEEDLINGKPAYELQVAMKDGKYEEEGWRLRKDGSRFWANVVITAVYDPQGIHIGYSKVTRDLTERKQAERALRESYDRYRQLAEQLRIANDELSYTNQELEQFTSIVSHDLQEPVRTIKSFLQLTEKRLANGNTPEIEGYIRKSVMAAFRMQDLIRNLLSYAQLTKHELMPARVLTSDVVHSALGNLRSAVEAADAKIDVEISAEAVWGDSIQLVQLLQNIVSNALKFVNRAAPHILIRVYDSGDVITFMVRDNGIGIAAEDIHKVFDIFRRLNTEREYPGTGIGLAICKKIVDRHGGKIWLESEQGAGTTFYFTIPRA